MTVRRFQLKLPEPLLGLAYACQVHCVAGCCGTAAFEPDARHMLPWVREHGPARAEQALGQLADLMGAVARHTGKVRSHWRDGFNDGWASPRECLDYLSTWRGAILEALARSAGAGEFDPAWLGWDRGSVLHLARAMDEGGDYGLLPVLADALEEAGCADQAVLSHCRRAEPHAGACWVVELLLRDGGRKGTGRG
jgi:hypothetical protein